MTLESNRRGFLVHTVGALTGIALLPDPLEALPVLQGQALDVAIVGVGRHGRAIIAELQKIPQVRIAAICDNTPSHLEAGASRAKGAATFPDHRALLEQKPEIKAIVVATPTHTHRPIVEDCLAAGRHVYCEAPIAHTVDDCRALAKAAASAKTVCQAGFQGRSNPTYRRARPLVETELRQMVSMYAQSNRKTTWRFPSSDPAGERAANWRLDPDVSIGLAGELGSHQFDVIHWFHETYPKRISGRGGVRVHKDGRTIADTIAVDLFWDDGVEMRYTATLGSSFGGQYELFTAAGGTIRLGWTHSYLFKEADAPTQGWEVYATRQEFFGEEGIMLVADATKLAAQGDLKAGMGLPFPSLYRFGPSPSDRAGGARRRCGRVDRNAAVVDNRSAVADRRRKPRSALSRFFFARRILRWRRSATLSWASAPVG